MKQSLMLTVIIMISVAAHSKNVKRNDIRSFAENFQCDDPSLKFQFDNLYSIYDQNEKMAQKSRNRLNIVDEASDLGGDGEWMYRGVTNRQFNERQILRLIFNDSTSVSESRWFSGKMFNEAQIAQGAGVVSMRADFQSLTFDKRWSAFSKAFTHVRSQIDDLITTPNSMLNDFASHIKIGSTFNYTPQAIQFLTPHKSYAESYGEFVLHVKEVVRRGVDVERYNYHNPSWSYSIGSIYRLDRDEYMVPSHIPSWDVHVVKVRNGTGWHKGDYGPPIYYYTKMNEDKNPCNVTGIRIDKPDPRNIDSNRVPVGVLLLCDKGETCTSAWDNSLPETDLNRLKAVVKDNTINDKQIYYVPYAFYQSANPELLKKMNLSTIVNLYSHLKPEVINDKKLWREILKKNFFNEPKAAYEFINLHSSISENKAMLSREFDRFIKNNKLKVNSFEVEYVMRLAKWLGKLQNKDLPLMLENFMTKANERAAVFQKILELKNEDQSYKPFSDNLREIYSKLDGKTAQEEVSLIQLDLESNKYNDALIQAVVKGLETDQSYRGQYWSTLVGDDSFKITVLELAMVYFFQNHPSHKLTDSINLYKTILPNIVENPDKHKILGLCIDYEIATTTDPAWKLIEKISGLELPKDREIDTLRSLWGVAKNEHNYLPADTPKDQKTNKFKFIASWLRRQIFWKLSDSAAAKDLANGNNNEMKILKNSFNQFFMEFVSPPAPLLGFAALNAIRKVSDNQDILFLWPDTDSKLNVEGVEYDIKKTDMEAILGQSLSPYYLLQLLREIQKAEEQDDTTRVTSLKLSVKKTMSAYLQYMISPNGVIADLDDDFIKSLFNDMYQWNKNENLVGLSLFLAKIYEDDQATVDKIKSVTTKLQIHFPDMYVEIPESLNGDNFNKLLNLK